MGWGNRSSHDRVGQQGQSLRGGAIGAVVTGWGNRSSRYGVGQ